MSWEENYDPLHSPLLSTLFAALPVLLLLGSIALLKIRIHYAALLGLGAALAIALGIYQMPLKPALASAVYGAAYGLFPIGWIILNLIFLYDLTVKAGRFEILRASLARLAPDPRIQVILIAFCFGAFFEGAAGFGTPVAVTAAILIQLGFSPLQASGLSLIANTAPVAFGALGTPIIALSGVTGIPEIDLSRMIGRQLPFFSLLIPFWVVWAMVGFRRMIVIWPAALTAGLGFAIPQFLVSNLRGPSLVDIVASVSSMAALTILLKFWQPKDRWKLAEATVQTGPTVDSVQHPRKLIVAAWAPWFLLTALVFLWGTPQVKRTLDRGSAPVFSVPGLHRVLSRGPIEAAPVVASVADPGSKPVPATMRKPEDALFRLNWLSATGTGILVAALLAGCMMGFAPITLARSYWQTIVRVRFSLVTIAALLGLGYVTRYSGTDTTLGLALARTGKLCPFFGTLL